MQGVQVRSLVRELRFHMPCDTAKINFKKLKLLFNSIFTRVPVEMSELPQAGGGGRERRQRTRRSRAEVETGEEEGTG